MGCVHKRVFIKFGGKNTQLGFGDCPNVPSPLANVTIQLSSTLSKDLLVYILRIQLKQCLIFNYKQEEPTDRFKQEGIG